jgi:hypothetical protein
MFTGFHAGVIFAANHLKEETNRIGRMDQLPITKKQLLR